MGKIVLLEDDEGIREVLELILTSEDYVVQSFSSIGAFKKRDLTIRPDLFIFDVMLPDGSGIDLCKEIREADDNQDIPVLIMSAHARLADLKGICHADGFIAKPFDINVLLNRIKSLVA